MECTVIWRKAGKFKQFERNRRSASRLRQAFPNRSMVCSSTEEIFRLPRVPAARPARACSSSGSHGRSLRDSPHQEARYHISATALGCPSNGDSDGVPSQSLFGGTVWKPRGTPVRIAARLRDSTFAVSSWARAVQDGMATQHRSSNQVPVLGMSTHVTCSGGQYFSSL
jgi:hypothetical protein